MRAFLIGLMLLICTASLAEAQCRITNIRSATTLSTANPSAPLSSTSQNAVAATLTVSLRVNTTIGTGCGLAFRISGTLTSGSGQTISYGISTSSSGSPLISYTTTVGATAPATTLTFTLPIYLIIPAGVYLTGTYTDGTARLEAYNTATRTLLAARTLVPTLQYTQTVCTIGGGASGGTRTLDFSNGRQVSTVAQTASFGSVSCNNSATIRLTSSKGAATSTGSGGTSHQNFFNYTAATTVNGTTATLNTSANAATGSAEQASASITSFPTLSAPLNITVTPIAPAKPLVAGSYSDVLTVTITPN